jgi:hypothetical protein
MMATATRVCFGSTFPAQLASFAWEGDRNVAAKHERLEVDREDLLAEATALVDRVELAVAGSAEPVVIGFRAQGAASIYFGADPAYHFNSNGELRRAYCDGLLYKAEQGRLVALDRRRTDVAVELVRQVLSEAEQAAFVLRIADELRRLHGQLAAAQFQVRGQVSSGGNVIERVRTWLDAMPLPPAVARRPNVAG